MADSSSTVPGPNTPAPANNAKTLLLQSDENLYVRPTAGNNAASGGSVLGPGATAADAPAGPMPGYAINWAGNPPSAGGTQVGPDMGQGATILAPSSGDRPSGGKDAADTGTVGNSGPQQVGPGPTPSSTSGMPDIDHDGDSL